MINKKIRALFGGSQRTSFFTVIKYFYKKTGNIKRFPVNLKYSHIFHDTIGPGAVFPCETTRPNLVGQMFSSQKKRRIYFVKWPWK